MSASTKLQLPYLAQGQAQKHVTVNESLLRLDAIVQLSVVSATIGTQPASPSDGDVYILPAGKTGNDWGGMADWALAYYRDGAWEEITPREGWIAFDNAAGRALSYTGAAWLALPTLGANTFTGGQTIVYNSSPALALERSDGAGGPVVRFYRSDNAPSTPAVIGQDEFVAKNASNADISFTRHRGVLLDGTAGSEDGRWEVWTMVAGALATRFCVGGGVWGNGAIGGDRGVGAANFTAIYDDNVLLTCGPIELLLEGGVDLAKWDALVPNRAHPAVMEDVIETETVEIDGDVRSIAKVVGARMVRDGFIEERRHEPMHAFAAMLAEGFDPRDPDNFCARMKADGAVPGLMTEAEWRAMQARGDKPDIGTAMTRTFLALDNLAVAFSALVARSAALETRISQLESGRS